MFGRLELYCPVADAGFEFPRRRISKGLVSKQEIANNVRRRKAVGDLPPVYPNGWFGLIHSEELAVGATMSINALGENFALFRDEQGKVHILDAYCAHLGANLGITGKVIGKCIECPFHGWQYDGETGHCTKIPYSNGKIPSQAKVKVWPSLEINGLVCVWYDAEGREPAYFPREYDKIKSGRWTYRGYSTHLVHVHIEDIPENGADILHLTYLHSAGVSSGSGTDFKNLLSGKLHYHEWSVNWEALSPPDSHIGHMTLKVANVILGVRIKQFYVNVSVDQIGPGLVFLTFDSILGGGVLIQTVTPQEPLLQKYTIRAYVDWWIPTFIVRLFVNGYDVQLERDMIVWNNKRYNLKPLLVKEDELILKHRRWFSQFYSENSPRFSFKKDDLSF